MENPKLLITAGCSFSQVPNSDVAWPVPLKEYLDCEVLYLGQGAAGNGIISKKVIYHTLKALEQYNASDILVGIMWSGIDRKEVYLTNNITNYNSINHGPDNDRYRNPLRLSSDIPDSLRHYYIINTHWNDDLTQTYIKHFHDDTGSLIQTLEHILRVQWFLENRKIKYFMTQYSFDVLPISTSEVYKNPDVKHLYDQLDFTNWLPIENMYRFACDSGLPFARPPDPHPSTEHHKLMVDTVLIPHLKNKGYCN